MADEARAVEPVIPAVSEFPWKQTFCVALVSALLLMASGLFIGTIGIDDELNLLHTSFDAVGRGLWAQQLLIEALPGRIGVTFIAMLLGCSLYAASIVLTLYLWRPIKPETGYVSAALMGAFPYFASSMTFDVAQIAYPLGFLLITISVFFVFHPGTIKSLGLSAAAFALAFSLYQGVATTYATVWVSTVGMRYLTSANKSDWVKWLPITIKQAFLSAAAGGVLYLLTVKLSKILIPYRTWSGAYEVRPRLSFVDPQRFAAGFRRCMELLLGQTGDLPGLPVLLFMVAAAMIALCIASDSTFNWRTKAILLPSFLASFFLLPFWIMLVQATSLSPRSTVGLGVLYGFAYAFLAGKSHRRLLPILTGLAAIIVLQFIFLGNEMYYTQFLASQADQLTVTRAIGRIDAISQQSKLAYPVQVVFIGKYVPAHGKFARFDTLGHSPLGWGKGIAKRQEALFELYGADGIRVNRDDQMRRRVTAYIRAANVPAWPDPGSVFVYKGSIVVVNFGLA